MEQLWYQQDVIAVGILDQPEIIRLILTWVIVGPLGFDLESKFSTQLSIQQEWFHSQCQFAFDHSAPIILMEFGAHQALIDSWTSLISQSESLQALLLIAALPPSSPPVSSPLPALSSPRVY
jgi:hypothetical protein